MVDFVGPEVFTKENLPVVNEDGYDVVSLPSGSTLYRADSGGATTPSEGVPVFFGDKKSIAPYMRGNPDSVSSYTTTSAKKLFVLSYPNLVAMIRDEEMPDNVKDFLTEFYLLHGDVTPEQWEKLATQGFVPAKKEDSFLFLAPSMRLAPLKEGEYPVYANRVFADIVCQIGFEGWIALPGTMIQRNVDLAYYKGNQQQLAADDRMGAIRHTYNVYAPEIVLCDWKAATAPPGAVDVNAIDGGKRKKRRKTRKVRASRKV